VAERCYVLAMKTLLRTVHSNKFANMAVFLYYRRKWWLRSFNNTVMEFSLRYCGRRKL